MTADKIREMQAEALTSLGWLREIALQLAELNEGTAPQPIPAAISEPVSAPEVKRGPGRPRKAQ